MGNLASQQLSSQSDPDVVRRQILADREKQLAGISNPQQQLAARLGGLLGGGLTNLYQDKGFFEVNDPLLNKVSKIQNIYNEVAGRIDPTADPVKFYSELQNAYSQANLGREALAASQEGLKAKATGLDLTIKETSLLEKSPEFVAQKIEEARGRNDDAEVTRLLGLQKRYNEDRDLGIKAKQTAIRKDEAYIAYQNKLATDSKFEYKLVDPTNPLSGHFKFDKSGNTDPVYVPVPKDVAAQILPAASSKDTKDKKDKAPLNSFATGSTTPAAAAPAQQTSWSGVPVNAPVAPAISPSKERDFIIQRAYPTLVVSTMDENTKAELAKLMGL